MKKFLIIDGSSLFFRAFYALPLLTTKKGIYTNAVYGFTMMLENIRDDINPNNIVVCFDMKGKTFRNDFYSEYKGTRQKTPNELEQQYPMVREVLKHMNIKILESPVYEADDIAGTLSKRAEGEGYEVYLLTGDRDFLQLASDKTKVIITKKGITDTVIYTENSFIEEYGITPTQFIDLKGFMGDASDNIPGVQGVGEKTGLKLIKEFQTMEGVYENIDNVSGAKLKEKLEDQKDMAFLSKKLATIIRTVPLDVTIDDLENKPVDFESLSKLYKDLEMNTLLKRLPDEYQGFNKEKISSDYDYINGDVEKLKRDVKKIGSFAFKFLSDGKIYNGVNPAYLGIKPKGKETHIFKLETLDIVQDLKLIFQDGEINKLGHGLRDDIVTLMGLDIELSNYTFDSKIAEYLLDPGDSKYDINNLSSKHFNSIGKSLEDIQGKGSKKKNLEAVNGEDVSNYLSYLLNLVYELEDTQLNLIEEQNMTDLYKNVELPLIEVLASMEYEGITVDESVLQDVGNSISGTIEQLESDIYEEAGREFNINSPKQLGVILFEEMNLPVIKKTKTGYSTSVEVLEKLQGTSPIIECVLEYRQLAKLNSTYVQGLIPIINKEDGKIHSTFNQTVAATGRISSTDPNLQNIPIKTDVGRLIRKAFVPAAGNKFIDADYSQIELRILAHVSEDENMLKAFRENEDIHTTTASQVFHVDKEEVTPLMRSRAKAVNFGIVYGISDYGLSRDLKIPRSESKVYIDNYLEHFSGVNKFMKEIVETGKKQGFVETIFHRRRYIPELSAKNFNIRSFGERIALNTPIQGSSADIIKIAMVRVYNALKEEKLKSKLILQIHDELIVEGPESEVDHVAKLLQEVMESSAELIIPIDVDLNVGDSWYDTK